MGRVVTILLCLVVVLSVLLVMSVQGHRETKRALERAIGAWHEARDVTLVCPDSRYYTPKQAEQWMADRLATTDTLITCAANGACSRFERAARYQKP